MVAPHAGAWIETALIGSPASRRAGSRPTRARGLKPSTFARTSLSAVSRPTRARGLKLANMVKDRASKQVAPHAGAWIETFNYGFRARDILCRAPRGRVD